MISKALKGCYRRRDSYGFFLRPVDTAQVPGYADVIKRPMDFGTISNKVSKGKYRTLEEFSVCFIHLVLIMIIAYATTII